jgi:hypothetical protein
LAAVDRPRRREIPPAAISRNATDPVTAGSQVPPIPPPAEAPAAPDPSSRCRSGTFTASVSGAARYGKVSLNRASLRGTLSPSFSASNAAWRSAGTLLTS